MSFALGDNVKHNISKKTGTVIKVTEKMCLIQWTDGTESRAKHTSLTTQKTTPKTIRRRVVPTLSPPTASKGPKLSLKKRANHPDDLKNIAKQLDFNDGTTSFLTVTYNTLGPHHSISIFFCLVAFISYLMNNYTYVVLASLAAGGTLYHKYKRKEVVVEEGKKKKKKKKKKEVVVEDKKTDNPLPKFESTHEGNVLMGEKVVAGKNRGVYKVYKVRR
jgi:hypothetical protein